MAWFIPEFCSVLQHTDDVLLIELTKLLVNGQVWLYPPNEVSLHCHKLKSIPYSILNKISYAGREISRDIVIN